MYLGSLVPQKGFHLLAKIWLKVVERVPNARLVVIGSGKLYDSNAQLGDWNIADKNYEDKYIKPFLVDIESGNPHASVKLMGKMGLEKKELLSK